MIALLLARVPARAYWLLAGAALVGGAYFLGCAQEAELASRRMTEYKGRQVAAAQAIVQKEVQVVTQTETVYRDRIQKIYVRGAEIEKSITPFVQPADDARCVVNTGLVRILDAAWAGHAAGPAADSDREPATVSLSDVAAVEAGNAMSCHAWREQVLGWRDFYAGQQQALNGFTGAWYGVAP